MFLNIENVFILIEIIISLMFSWLWAFVFLLVCQTMRLLVTSNCASEIQNFITLFLQSSAPEYIANSAKPYNLSLTLRSLNSHLLNIPRIKLKPSGDLAFLNFGSYNLEFHASICKTSRQHVNIWKATENILFSKHLWS